MSNLRTDHEIEIDKIHDRQLAEKDAEIESLEGQLAVTTRVCNENTDLKKLITELADALDRCDPIQISIQEVAALVQRAREATR